MIASAPWQIHGRVNCHHLALRLAESNRVLFVESPGLRAPRLGHGPDLAKVLRRLAAFAAGAGRKPRAVGDRLYVLSPIVLPWHGRPGVAAMNGRLLAGACGRAIRRLGFRRPLLWIFLPSAAHVVGRLGESAVIYHCTDDYAGNPGVNAAAIERLERRLLGEADLVFATSRPLADRLESGAPGRVVCVPNVAETERFEQVPPPPADVAALRRPVVGYVGNVASYMVDTALVEGVARARPDWSIVLVGPLGVGDPSTRLGGLPACPNVHLLGPRAYEQIPAYVHAFDVCLVPFARNRVTEGALPLKAVEYLAAGKPVVSRPLAALVAEPLAGVMRFADDADGFVRAIEAGLRDNDAPAASARREMARRYSWKRRFPEIQDHVETALQRRDRTV